MKKILPFLLLFLKITASSQSDNSRNVVYFDGLKQLPIKVFVSVNGNRQNKYIKKNDLLKYGLQISLSDTTYKIIGFTGSYDCHSGSLLDITVITFLGNRIKANNLFLRYIWVGDLLVLQNINVVKKGKRYSVDPRLFNITN